MSGTADDNGNSKRRVANYELHAQLSEVNSNVVHLIRRFDDYCERADKVHDDHEGRIRGIESEKLPEIHTDIAAIRERQGILALVQGTLTFIGSAIAAAIGSNK